MSDRLVITLDAEGELARRLGEAIQGLQHPEDLMGAIGARLETNVQRRFDTKRDPAGNSWASLMPSTVKSYLKLYAGNIPGSLLDRTRHMRGSLTHNPGPDFVDVGFSDPKAAYHVFGTKHMVRRDPLTANPETGQLGDEDRQDVLDEIEAFLSSALAG